MRFYVLLIFGLLSSCCFAQDLPPIPPMPQYPGKLPAGVNPLTFPNASFGWFDRVKQNIADTKKDAATCELVFDGDSITDGWHGGGHAVWQQHYAKFNALDFGILGDRTQHVLWRLLQGQAAGMHPKLIALMIGTNNVNRNTDDEVVAGIRAVVDAYQKCCPDAVILLQAILPRGEKPDDVYRGKIKDVDAQISKFDDGKKVIFVDFGDKFLQPDGTISRDILFDFTHPTAKGYEIWADAIQPFIDKYVGGNPPQ